MTWEAAQDEPMSNTVVLACRFIEEHQNLIGRPSKPRTRPPERATAKAEAE